MKKSDEINFTTFFLNNVQYSFYISYPYNTHKYYIAISPCLSVHMNYRNFIYQHKFQKTLVYHITDISKVLSKI